MDLPSNPAEGDGLHALADVHGQGAWLGSTGAPPAQGDCAGGDDPLLLLPMHAPFPL